MYVRAALGESDTDVLVCALEGERVGVREKARARDIWNGVEVGGALVFSGKIGQVKEVRGELALSTYAGFSVHRIANRPEIDATPSG